MVWGLRLVVFRVVCGAGLFMWGFGVRLCLALGLEYADGEARPF